MRRKNIHLKVEMLHGTHARRGKGLHTTRRPRIEGRIEKRTSTYRAHEEKLCWPSWLVRRRGTICMPRQAFQESRLLARQASHIPRQVPHEDWEKEEAHSTWKEISARASDRVSSHGGSMRIKFVRHLSSRPALQAPQAKEEPHHRSHYRSRLEGISLHEAESEPFRTGAV